MKKWLSYAVWFLAIPAVIGLGATVFESKRYAFISLLVALLACVPFFLTFERREQTTGRLILIAVMTALSVAGRIVFGALPGFKPVTAMVVITAMYLGSEAGFLTGALTAVISNFYFAQGPWTPFQMFTWGMIGFLAGLLSGGLRRSRVMLVIYGALAGAAFSMIMDVWTVLWWDGAFSFARYGAAIAASAYFTVIYAVSNVLFLLLLAKPVGEKLKRVLEKYGIE